MKRRLLKIALILTSVFIIFVVLGFIIKIEGNSVFIIAYKKFFNPSQQKEKTYLLPEDIQSKYADMIKVRDEAKDQLNNLEIASASKEEMKIIYDRLNGGIKSSIIGAGFDLEVLLPEIADFERDYSTIKPSSQDIQALQKEISELQNKLNSILYDLNTKLSPILQAEKNVLQADSIINDLKQQLENPPDDREKLKKLLDNIQQAQELLDKSMVVYEKESMKKEMEKIQQARQFLQDAKKRINERLNY